MEEWLALPELGIRAVKAKIDTGARTSSLHAHKIETFTQNNSEWVRFWFYPAQKDTNIELVCESEIVDQRFVTDSGGHKEKRIVIRTVVIFDKKNWPIEITLSSREQMQFRMLLGRTAIVDGGFTVDPSQQYLGGTHLDSESKHHLDELSQ